MLSSQDNTFFPVWEHLSAFSACFQMVNPFGTEIALTTAVLLIAVIFVTKLPQLVRTSFS